MVSKTGKLDGNGIDACLLILTSLFRQRDNIMVLPNSLLTDAVNVSDFQMVSTWLPEAFPFADTIVMVAHNTDHWCLAVISHKQGRIYYINSHPGVGDASLKQKHLKVLMQLYKCKFEGNQTYTVEEDHLPNPGSQRSCPLVGHIEGLLQPFLVPGDISDDDYGCLLSGLGCYPLQ